MALCNCVVIMVTNDLHDLVPRFGGLVNISSHAEALLLDPFLRNSVPNEKTEKQKIDFNIPTLS